MDFRLRNVVVFSLLAAPIYAQLPFKQLVVFGDSLSDNGNFYYGSSLEGDPTPAPPQYATGEYTDGTNSVPSTSSPLGLWIDQLPPKLNLAVPQPYAKGGLNYATASARTGSNPAYLPGKPSVAWSTDQVNAFLKSHSTAPSDYLYIFWCGGDDILNNSSPTAAAANLQANIETLANAGAKYFLWMNLPPMGEVPLYIGTGQSAAFDAAAVSFNNAMAAAVTQLTSAHPAIEIVVYDTYTRFLTLAQNPALYGFANITAAAQGLAGMNPNTYLFWDPVHPTTVGHAEIAGAVYAVILSAFEGRPFISSVVNAEDANATIAPNTWVAVKGTALSMPGDTRIWLGSDFVSGDMPQALDTVSVTFNGEKGYVYYISPTQINVLTPPDLAADAVTVAVSVNGGESGLFTVQGQALAPSFFVFDATHVTATHLGGAFLGPATLYPGLTTPAQPGETVVLYANGFGPTSVAVTPGSSSQSGVLPSLPLVTIGGTQATVLFAGLVSPGLFQFNVVVPPGTSSGDIPLSATFDGASTQSGVVIAVGNQ
ncbi:MAG TPA: SGNH/GDSL hydrolase family protein [Bryobacteraceae bacterium]|nr:SGNH/GDSL hydrolase family protein [Bryobacteraceae bacterium]